jgi:hypothetical protein
MKRIVAVFFYLCYKLETHYILHVSLKHWLWVAAVGAPVLALLGQLSWRTAVPVSVVSALLLAGIAWARRRQYVVFSQGAPEAASSQARGQRAPWVRGSGQDRQVVKRTSTALEPIQVDEQVRCRAFGLFAVNDKERYVINEDAQYSFVRTREHIVMAWVRRTRFLLLATSLKQAVGWWYVFLTPDRLQELRLGTLSCGLRSQAALSVRYRPEHAPDQVQELYLAFQDAATQQRVVKDLRLDGLVEGSPLAQS